MSVILKFLFMPTQILNDVGTVGRKLTVDTRDLVEWLERCASIPMITSPNPSGGSEFSFRSDLLLTARGGST
jgi:hypothetical protein